MSLGQIHLSDCTFKEFLIVTCSRADHMDYFCFNILRFLQTQNTVEVKKKKKLYFCWRSNIPVLRLRYISAAFSWITTSLCNMQCKPVNGVEDLSHVLHINRLEKWMCFLHIFNQFLELSWKQKETKHRWLLLLLLLILIYYFFIFSKGNSCHISGGDLLQTDLISICVLEVGGCEVELFLPDI